MAHKPKQRNQADNYPDNTSRIFFEEDIHLRDYLRVLNKQKWTVIATFIIIVTTVAIKTFSSTPIYSASLTIKIEKEPPKVLKFEDVLPVDASGTDYYQTQYKIIQSRTIAKKVIEKLSLWKHPQFKKKGLSGVARAEDGVLMENMEALTDSFLDNLEVEPIRNSRLVKITYNTHYPDLSALIANTLAQTYIDFNLESKFNATEKARDWLSNQLLEFQIKVEKSEEALNKFARKNGIFSLEKNENLVIKRLEDINEELSAAKSDRIGKESLYNQLVKFKDRRSFANIDNSYINELKKERLKLETEYFRLSKLFKSGYPKIVRIKAQIRAVDDRLDKEVNNIISSAEEAYKVALERERLLQSAFDKQRELALKMKEKAVQYNILKREVDTNQELYNGLLQRVKETGVSAGLESSNIQIVDKAVPPLLPSKPRKKLNILLSMVAGLFLGVGLAFFTEYLDNTVKDPDEIRRLFDLPTLGIIPSFESSMPKAGKGGRKKGLANDENIYLLSHNHPRSSISEACRTFRTSLLFSSPGRPPRIILITSNNPSEGKTFITCNLATVMANSGAKTLVIDCDLRKPVCHKAFSRQNVSGLTDYITGNAQLKDIIKPTDVKDLYVITSGPIPPNPPELLDSEQFMSAIKESAKNFDFVIIDSAPIMAFADSLNVANKVDGTVLVVKGGKTTKDDLKHAVELIEGMNASVMGIVLNSVDIKKGNYGYYRYYAYKYQGDDTDAKEPPSTV